MARWESGGRKCVKILSRVCGSQIVHLPAIVNQRHGHVLLVEGEAVLHAYPVRPVRVGNFRLDGVLPVVDRFPHAPARAVQELEGHRTAVVSVEGEARLA